MLRALLSCYKSKMYRLLLSLITTLFLLGQLGLIAHASEEHDDDKLCELCLVASQQDHALASSSTQIQFDTSFIVYIPSPSIAATQTTESFFSARAPPLSI